MMKNSTMSSICLPVEGRRGDVGGVEGVEDVGGVEDVFVVFVNEWFILIFNVCLFQRTKSMLNFNVYKFQRVKLTIIFLFPAFVK